MRSIIQKDRTRCFICGKNAQADYFGLDEHHVFGGPNRKLSEEYGLKVYLCHHSCHLHGVHKHNGMNKALKATVQQMAMEHYGWTVDEFRRIFGKSYL